MKIEGVMCYILLIISGCIYALERFLFVFKWVNELRSGSYIKNPTMSGIFVNMFV